MPWKPWKSRTFVTCNQLWKVYDTINKQFHYFSRCSLLKKQGKKLVLYPFKTYRPYTCTEAHIHPNSSAWIVSVTIWTAVTVSAIYPLSKKWSHWFSGLVSAHAYSRDFAITIRNWKVELLKAAFFFFTRGRWSVSTSALVHPWELCSMSVDRLLWYAF
jgi:hypothetical protein